MPDPKHILIVDDEPANVKILTDVLAPQGYHLSVADDGRVGLEKALRDKPDVLLLDLVLPGLSGLEVLQEMQAKQPETIVIVTTAYGSEATAVEALRRGVRDYVVNKRPFDREEVLQVVRRAIAEGELRRENARLTQQLVETNKQLAERNRQLEETVHRLQAANEKLKELDGMKSSFLSMISHELRAPLTVAKGYIDLAESESAGKNERVREFLHVAADNCKHLAQMIDDLLDISRMEAGRYKIDPQPTRMGKLITQAVASLTGAAAGKGVTLQAHVPADLPLVHADPVRILQVLTNLLNNAIKFTPEGGKITVTASLATANHRPPTAVQLPSAVGGRPPALSQVEGSAVVITVTDTGIGIPPHELEAIFDKFYQVQRAAEPEPRGVGLGLAICREIVALHGGRIWAESDGQHGSVFRFTLPKADA